jgi:hypothetical protein
VENHLDHLHGEGGADEKRLEHELHADIRRLHAEVVALRAELRSAVADRAQERK